MRVYSSGRTCENAYQVGARYRVHARHVPRDQDSGIPTDVSLAMGPCMAHAEMLAFHASIAAIPYWAWRGDPTALTSKPGGRAMRQGLSPQVGKPSGVIGLVMMVREPASKEAVR